MAPQPLENPARRAIHRVCYLLPGTTPRGPRRAANVLIRGRMPGRIGFLCATCPEPEGPDASGRAAKLADGGPRNGGRGSSCLQHRRGATGLTMDNRRHSPPPPLKPPRCGPKPDARPMQRSSIVHATFVHSSCERSCSRQKRAPRGGLTGSRRGSGRISPSSRSASGAAGTARPSPPRSRPCGGAWCCRAASSRSSRHIP